MNEALNTFKDYLGLNKLKFTQQRLLIFKVFLSQNEQLTSEHLFDKVKDIDDCISRSTVYRTVKHLQNSGIARCIHLGDGSTHYEPMGDHHSQMICEQCGKHIPIINPYADCLQQETARQQGFTLFRFQTVLYGICVECNMNKTTKQRDNIYVEKQQGSKS